MANILDYLDWRGDLTLAERGFNEVDNLLMAELCFLDFSGIVPADFSAPVFLPDAMRQYDAARPQETMGVLVPEQIPELGHKMAASRRFSDLTLCAYVSRTGDEGTTGGTVTLAREGLLRINYLSREGGAAAGDYVATSGKGGIYPRGLLIGEIQSVSPDSDGLTMTAQIQPFADIKNLSSVFVLTDFSEKNAS